MAHKMEAFEYLKLQHNNRIESIDNKIGKTNRRNQKKKERKKKKPMNQTYLETLCFLSWETRTAPNGFRRRDFFSR